MQVSLWWEEWKNMNNGVWIIRCPMAETTTSMQTGNTENWYMAYEIITARCSDDLGDELSGAPTRWKPSQPDIVPPADGDDIYADLPTNQPRFSSGIGQLPLSDEEEDKTMVRLLCSISSCHWHALIRGQPQSSSPVSHQTHPTSPPPCQTKQVIVDVAANPTPAQFSTATHCQSCLTPPPSSPSCLLSPLTSPPAESNQPTKSSCAKKIVQPEHWPPSTCMRDKSWNFVSACHQLLFLVQ